MTGAPYVLDGLSVVVGFFACAEDVSGARLRLESRSCCFACDRLSTSRAKPWLSPSGDGEISITSRR